MLISILLRDTGYGVPDTGYGIRDTGYGTRDKEHPTQQTAPRKSAQIGIQWSPAGSGVAAERGGNA